MRKRAHLLPSDFNKTHSYYFQYGAKEDCEESDLNSSSLPEQSSMAQLALLAIIFPVGRGLQTLVRAFKDFVVDQVGLEWKVWGS